MVRLSDVDEIRSEAGRQLIDWLSQYKFFARKQVEIVDDIVDVDSFKMRLYTTDNVYAIVAINPGFSCLRGYLGCVASKRKSRPGETWTRGNDLPDGKFNEETLRRIMGSIVFYESKEIVKSREMAVEIEPSGPCDIKGYNPPPKEGVRRPENPTPPPPPKCCVRSGESC